jgi:methionyl-tRNA formyltransferase
LIDKKSILIGCEKGSIRVFNVQAPSKKEVEVISYVNGKRLSLEDILS